MDDYLKPVAKIPAILPWVPQQLPSNSVIVEIGSERGEGSTLWLADLAEQHGIKLHTVDIDSRPRWYNSIIPVWWKFYQDVRAPDWPDAQSIDALSLDRQQECRGLHGWDKIEAQHYQRIDDLHRSPHRLEAHPAITWHIAPGSTWAQNYACDEHAPISVLYLDNFDYIWDAYNPDPGIDNQRIEYLQRNINMNNQACQLEHMQQLLALEPCLAPGAIVAFDDTYLYNDCWIGKNGPGVVYLLARGYELLHAQDTFVILRLTKQ